MEDYQLTLFEPKELQPEINRTRHRTQPQSCDDSIMSRGDRLKARNRAMVARYYYWAEIERRRFDDVLKILSEREFFLDERRINLLLLEEDEYFVSLCDKKPSRADLRRQYPGFDWNASR